MFTREDLLKLIEDTECQKFRWYIDLEDDHYKLAIKDIVNGKIIIESKKNNGEYIFVKSEEYYKLSLNDQKMINSLLVHCQ